MPAGAAITESSVCKKVDVTTKVGAATFKCTKVAKKLVWLRFYTQDEAKQAISELQFANGKISDLQAKLDAAQAILDENENVKRALAQRYNPFSELLAKAYQDFLATTSAETANYASNVSSSGKLCAPGVLCLVGSAGPGGGIIFYDAGAQQSWGRYLEFAPEGWSGDSGDPSEYWCDVTSMDFSAAVTDAKLKLSIGNEIGKGQANTDLMLALCKSGAANVAHAYKGGGLEDWFLPSTDELNELCKLAGSTNEGFEASGDCANLATLEAGFSDAGYWSSTESSDVMASYQDFSVGSILNFYKEDFQLVRPIRAF